MSLDSMRGSYGRCPPFVVAGLLVVCVILTFNWWSLSSQNYDLIKQLEELGEQLKISSEEQDLCVHQRLNMEGRVKTLEEDLAQLRVNLEQQRQENDEIKKTLDVKDEELSKVKKEQENTQKTATLCNTELESLKKLEISKDGTIASLRLEKNQFTAQLEERRSEVQQLRTDLEQVQAALDAANRSAKKAVAPPPAAIGKSSTAAPQKLGDNGISLDGDHEKFGAQDDRALNEENNAGEREEPVVDEGAAEAQVQDEQIPRMEQNQL